MVNLAGPRPLGNSVESMDLGFALQARCLEAVARGDRRRRGLRRAGARARSTSRSPRASSAPPLEAPSRLVAPDVPALPARHPGLAADRRDHERPDARLDRLRDGVRRRVDDRDRVLADLRHPYPAVRRRPGRRAPALRPAGRSSTTALVCGSMRVMPVGVVTQTASCGGGGPARTALDRDPREHLVRRRVDADHAVDARSPRPSRRRRPRRSPSGASSGSRRGSVPGRCARARPG